MRGWLRITFGGCRCLKRDRARLETGTIAAETTKSPQYLSGTAGSWKGVAGDDVLSHPITRAVPSALRGLTTVFGMGTGVALAP